MGAERGQKPSAGLSSNPGGFSITTLADQFLKAARDKKRTAAVIARQIAWAAGKIEQAQKFVFDAPTIEAVRSLLRSKPSTLIEATAFARLPYPLCWFEWPAPLDGPIAEHQIRVLKTGAVLEQLDRRANAFSIATAWTFDKAAVGMAVKDMELNRIVEETLGSLGVSALVGGVDFGAAPSSALTKEPWRFAHRDLTQATIEANLGRRFDEVDPVQVQALRVLHDLIAYRPNMEAGGAESLLAAADISEDYVRAKIRDVSDDIKPIIGMLILLNSRNGVTTRTHAPDLKLQRARVKRGQPELITYNEVTIKLGQGDARAADRHGVSPEQVRRHLVRGHFKVRKTGVYWWRNHIRGSETQGEMRHTQYKVTA